MDNFVVWKTIEIGGMTKDELLAAMREATIDTGGWARDIMSDPEFSTSSSKQSIKLARCKIKALGFTEKPTTTELRNRIQEVGDLGLPEVGPHLRLQFSDQPKNDYFWVAIDRLPNSFFCVERGDVGGRWLHGHHNRPDDLWSLDDEIVFVIQ